VKVATVNSSVSVMPVYEKLGLSAAAPVTRANGVALVPLRLERSAEP
jgi:sulfur transfer protein SufE